jgi:hypothetical protein
MRNAYLPPASAARIELKERAAQQHVELLAARVGFFSKYSWRPKKMKEAGIEAGGRAGADSYI